MKLNLSTILTIALWSAFQSAAGQTCINRTLYFQSDAYAISKSNALALDRILSQLDTSRLYLIEINGHTDQSHSDEYNLNLSQRRIDAVQRYIGLNRQYNNVFQINNYGETKPIAPDDHLNRRVELYITPLETDSSVLLQGKHGVMLKVPYKMFDSCGYCESGAKLVTTKSPDGVRQIGIDMQCHSVIKCLPIEINIPFYYFDRGGKTPKMANPIHFCDCHKGPIQFEDSIDVFNDDRFTVTLDSVNKQYVISNPCFEYKDISVICCATPDLDFVEFDITHLGRVQLLQIVFEHHDSLFSIRAGEVVRRPACDEVSALADINGELMFARCDFDKLQLLYFYVVSDTTKPRRYSKACKLPDVPIHRVYTVNEYLFSLIGDEKIRVKIPWLMKVDSLQVYYKNLDYFLTPPPMNQRKTSYTKSKLKSRLVFRHNGEWYAISRKSIKAIKGKDGQPDQLKIRYNFKRKAKKLRRRVNQIESL